FISRNTIPWHKEAASPALTPRLCIEPVDRAPTPTANQRRWTSQRYRLPSPSTRGKTSLCRYPTGRSRFRGKPTEVQLRSTELRKRPSRRGEIMEWLILPGEAGRQYPRRRRLRA